MQLGMCDVLGFGYAAVDDLIYVESYPHPDSKMRIVREERQCGGLTATALVAAARLGARCVYGGVLGSDELSMFVRVQLTGEGVDLTPLVLDERARPVHSSIIVDLQAGTRTILHDDGHACGAPEAGPDPTLVRAARALLIDSCGIPGMQQAALLARAEGIPRVGDFEYLCGREQMALIELVDHLIVSQGFAVLLTGECDPAEAAMALCSQERLVAVVTCGATGSWHAAAPARQDPVHMPAYVVDVVDTTGCGDVFHGAYAAGLSRGLPVVDCIRLAAATAALKATRPGGQAGIPRLPEVEALMRRVDAAAQA